MSELFVHQFLPVSEANGPGRRAVLWLQGCSLGCPGCFNPQTHSTSELTSLSESEGWPRRISVAEALELIAAAPEIEGLTLTGGEPLEQLPAVLSLLGEIRERTPLSVLVFTGYCWAEVPRLPGGGELLLLADVILAGRYVARQRVAAGLLGSANKTVHYLTDRYRPEDVEQTPEAEVVISAEGRVVLTGIDPLWAEDKPSSH